MTAKPISRRVIWEEICNNWHILWMSKKCYENSIFARCLDFKRKIRFFLVIKLSPFQSDKNNWTIKCKQLFQVPLYILINDDQIRASRDSERPTEQHKCEKIETTNPFLDQRKFKKQEKEKHTRFTLILHHCCFFCNVTIAIL